MARLTKKTALTPKRDKPVEEETPPRKNRYFEPEDPIKFIPSGSTLLDLALGGGWARGRVSNIVGDKAVGKTLIAIEACANFARAEPKGRIIYREAEAAFDMSYAEVVGFPVDRAEIDDPMETVEDLFEDLERVTAETKKDPVLYVLDSLDALTDRAEMDRKIDEGSYGTGKAKMLSQMFRRVVRGLSEKDITLMVISQVRENIGVTFGKKYTRSGGRALDFYASQRIDLAQLQRLKRTIKGVDRVTGTLVKAVVEKNKVGKAYRDLTFPILFGYGIDDRGSCLDYLAEEAKMTVAKDATIEELRKLVTDHWHEIEEAFTPKERKYG